MPHFIFLIFLAFVLSPLFILVTPIFTYGLGLPRLIATTIIWVSLIGGAINIGLTEISSTEPMIVEREISFFGFKWVFPEIVYRPKMILALNLGGAVIPLLISSYLLLYTIPTTEADPILSYIKIFVTTTIVIMIVNRYSRIVPGIGIAVPAFVPPIATATLSLLAYNVGVASNPCIIAYVSGTIGTLIGADILNLNKLHRLGAPLVSIGGAGTFDGIYMTGIVSVALVLLFII
jgi:uncharacterized membrane protein